MYDKQRIYYQLLLVMLFVFFFNDTATTEIYTGEDTLSLHGRSSDLCT